MLNKNYSEAKFVLLHKNSLFEFLVSFLTLFIDLIFHSLIFNYHIEELNIIVMIIKEVHKLCSKQHAHDYSSNQYLNLFSHIDKSTDWIKHHDPKQDD